MRACWTAESASKPTVGTKKRSGGTSSPPRLLAVAVLATASTLVTFENAADLKFFGGRGFAFDAWVALRPPPTTLLRLPCSEMARSLDAEQPILFQGCIPEHVGLLEVGYEPDASQNLFPFCSSPRRRHFEFRDAEGRSEDIIEQVPCAPSTLRQKLATFEAHNASRDGSYFEVHTRMLEAPELARFENALHATMRLPKALSVSKMSGPPTVTHFLHVGRTAVYYKHAHMDRFLSFCLQEEKRWTLIAPQFHRHFVSTWSGNAEMMLRETTRAPRLDVTQRRGDVLFVPPWWIHETRVRPGTKNYGVNVHWMSRGQVLGFAASLQHRFFRNPRWFYSE